MKNMFSILTLFSIVVFSELADSIFTESVFSIKFKKDNFIAL